MPPLPVLPKTIRMRVNATLAGIPIVNIFHSLYAGTPPTAADCNSLSSRFGVIWQEQFLPLLSTLYTMTSVDVEDLNSATGASGSTIFTGSGVDASGPEANSLSIVLSWHAPIRYRGGHPRTYLAGMARVHLLTAIQWDPQFAASVGAAGLNMFNLWNSFSLSPVTPVSLAVAHYKRKSNPNFVAFSEALTGLSVSPKIRSQRGRLS